MLPQGMSDDDGTRAGQLARALDAIEDWSRHARKLLGELREEVRPSETDPSVPSLPGPPPVV